MISTPTSQAPRNFLSLNESARTPVGPPIFGMGDIQSSQSNPSNSPIKVAIVEDNDSIRTGLAGIVRLSSDLCLAGLFPDAESVVRDIDAFAPDVVLMDINLPGASGIECVSTVKQRLPKTFVIMLTIEANTERVMGAIRAGASGYLTKNTPPERILEAIREVHRGGAPMSGQAINVLVHRVQHEHEAPRIVDGLLTPREREVLQLASEGLRAKEIAERLTISTFTVQAHIRNIYEKLGVRSLSQAIARLSNFGKGA